MLPVHIQILVRLIAVYEWFVSVLLVACGLVEGPCLAEPVWFKVLRCCTPGRVVGCVGC